MALRLACLISSVVGALPAQTTPSMRVGGSPSGYLYWVDHSVRAILGYPGAAQLGAPALVDVDFASISPDGRWAVIVKDGQTRIVRNFENVMDETLRLQTPDRVVWSSDQTVAILYSSAANVMQEIRLRENGPELGRETDLTAFGAVTMMAVAPRGDAVAVGFPGGVYLFTASQQPVRIPALVQPAGAVFAEDGASLYILDKAEHPVVKRFRREPLAEQDSFALDSEDGSSADPVSIQLSGNERYLLVADRAGQSLQVYDVASMRLSARLALDYAPADLELLTAGSTFFVKPGISNGTNISIVLAKDFPSVYFVPPPRPDL